MIDFKVKEQILNLTLGGIVVPTGVTVVRSVYSKLMEDHRLFEEAIYAYRLFPRTLIPFIAKVTIIWEIAIIITTFSPALIQTFATLIIGLGILFASAQISVLVRGMKITCGCYGANSSMVSGATLIAPAMFIIVGCSGLTLHSFLLSPKISEHLSWPNILTYYLGGILGLWGIYTIIKTAECHKPYG